MDVALTGVEIVRTKKLGIKTMQPLKKGKGVAINIAARVYGSSHHHLKTVRKTYKLTILIVFFHNLLSILSSFDDDLQRSHIKADSGAAKTYLKLAHMTYLKKVTKLLDPQDIYLPTNTSLTHTHTGALDFRPKLLDEAQQAQVVPDLSNSLLFSIGHA